MKLVSVIVPIYNAEIFLQKCIHSICEQTYQNLEIILVDDGSNDSSPHICDECAKTDCRIQVIHKENAGVSVARNTGLELATGTYVFFVDADDFLPIHAVERLYIAMEETVADLCSGTWFRISANSTKRLSCRHSTFSTDNKMELAVYLQSDQTNIPFGKLYRREIIERNKLRFHPKVTIAEDALFNYKYIQHCSIISSINEVVYYYNKLNAASITHHFIQGYAEAMELVVLEEIKNILCTQYPIESVLVQKIVCGRFINALGYIHYYRLPRKEELKQICAMYDRLGQYIHIPKDIDDDFIFGETRQITEWVEAGNYRQVYIYLKSKRHEKSKLKQAITSFALKIITKIKMYQIFGRWK